MYLYNLGLFKFGKKSLIKTKIYYFYVYLHDSKCYSVVSILFNKCVLLDITVPKCM